MTPDPAALAAFAEWWSEWERSKGYGGLYTWRGTSRSDVQDIWLAAWNARAPVEASDEEAAVLFMRLRGMSGDATRHIPSEWAGAVTTASDQIRAELARSGLAVVKVRP